MLKKNEKRMRFNFFTTKLENLISSSNGKINTDELNDYSIKVYKYIKKKHKKLLENIIIEKSDFGKNHFCIQLKTKK